MDDRTRAMLAMGCQVCAFGSFKAKAAVGECRRLAPRDIGEGYEARWPEVRCGEFCGEFVEVSQIEREHFAPCQIRIVFEQPKGSK